MSTFIPVSEPAISESEIELVNDAVKSGWVSSLGKYIEQFEKEFALFCNTPYAVSVFNGTVAIHLALVALGIGPGDEVIVPSLTFIATANAVLYTGATPVFVDSELETWNMDPQAIEKKVNKRTKAIIVVHLYGHPANMTPILKIAKKYKLKVIEDAAESHGAEFKGKKVGSIGDVGCFSFYGNKVITTGEGGMVVTKNKALANKMRFLKDHAMSTKRKYYHPLLGFNYRLTNLQGALGVAQMAKINDFIEKKKHIAQLYNSYLKNVPGLVLPPEASWAKNVYWMYSLLITKEAGMTRDKFAAELKKHGIDSRPFFVPNHQMPYFPSQVRRQKLKNAELLAQQGLNLPSSVLITDEQIKFISDTIKNILGAENTKNVNAFKITDKKGKPLRIALLQKNDAQALATFFSSLSENSQSTFQPHPLTAAFAQKLCDDAERTKHIRTVVWDKKKIVAYAFVTRPLLMSSNGYFGIAVTDAYQGRGISTVLMQKTFLLARQAGVHQIYLNVFANNTRAVKTYQKYGFSKVEMTLGLGKLFTFSELLYNGELGKTLSHIFSQSSQSNTEAHPVLWMKKEI